MRATTPRKKAMRTLFHAGQYLQEQQPGKMGSTRALNEALVIIATAYNELLRSAHDAISRN